MALRLSLIVVLSLIVASKAAVLDHNALQKRGPGAGDFMNVMLKNAEDLEDSLEALSSGLDDFATNFKDFLFFLEPIGRHFNEKYVKALMPMLEATPAEILKELLINILKALKSTMDELAVVIVERNPLHPEKLRFDDHTPPHYGSKQDPLHPEKISFDDPSVFSRALMDHFRRQIDSHIMTLGVWGNLVGKAFGALDTLVVNAVIGISNQIKEAEMQLDNGIKQMNAVPAEIIKTMILEGLKGNMHG